MTNYLALLPRDGLFCKDGRGWHTSSSGRGHTLNWPWPTTIRGTLVTALGRLHEPPAGQNWAALRDRVKLGRSLVLRRARSEMRERDKARSPETRWLMKDRIWPVPSDALWAEGATEVLPLIPEPPLLPTLGRDDDAARESLWFPKVVDLRKPLPSPLWWGEKPFVDWLLGNRVLADAPSYTSSTRTRLQSHVGIRADVRTADEGVLYAHDVLETLDVGGEWAIGVECSGPSAAKLNIATVGSDGRLARVEELAPQLFNHPRDFEIGIKAALRQSNGRMDRLRLVTVTATQYKRGWLPDFLEPSQDGTSYIGKLPSIDVPVRLCAAFVGRPQHISGWDMLKRSPKPTLRLAPPGSVYFVERTDGQTFTVEQILKLWLQAVGGGQDDGFGRLVPGLWQATAAQRTAS